MNKRPAKYKHLETGTAHIFGIDVDFVNLRGETYTEDSRSPQMGFATVEEDAIRGYAMVNAIFYNNEEYAGKEVQDMAAGIMRNPLDPYQSFMDDPLKVLRFIRFQSKLGHEINDSTKQSMKD